MNENLFEFYINRKGYDMAIVIPGKELKPNPENTPKPEPTPTPTPNQGQ